MLNHSSAQGYYPTVFLRGTILRPIKLWVQTHSDFGFPQTADYTVSCTRKRRGVLRARTERGEFAGRGRERLPNPFGKASYKCRISVLVQLDPGSAQTGAISVKLLATQRKKR